jgi:CBS domain-containing protein
MKVKRLVVDSITSIGYKLKTQEKMTVDKIMLKDITATTEDTPVVQLATAMLDTNLRMVPVVRDGKLVGVVVMSDIVSKIIRG